MYIIRIDGNPVHHPNMFADQCVTVNPILKMGLNTHGSLSFLLPPENPEYGKTRNIKTSVAIYDDAEEDRPVWRGRFLNEKLGMNSMKTVYCEGALAYLCDSIYRPYTYKGSVGDFFRSIIANHNAQVSEAEQFRVGRITVEDANEYIVRGSNTPTSSWKLITDKLIKPLGGYLNLRYSGDGATYIDYLADYNEANVQPVEFGKNIVDFSAQASAAGIITVLIPYGAQLDESDPAHETAPEQTGFWAGNRLTVRDYNLGRDYIESSAGIQMYGRIYGTNTWDDVTVVSNLYSKAVKYLQDKIRAAHTMEVTAIDLSAIDGSIPRIKIADLIPVRSVQHNIDMSLVCRQIVLPLMDLSQARYTLGAGSAAITDGG